MEPLTVDRARFPGVSDEELLLRLTMPAEQVDAIGRARPPRPGRAPLVRLLEELAKRPVIVPASSKPARTVIEYRRHAA